MIIEERKIPVLQETLVLGQKGDPNKKYKTIEKLGSGSYGIVYKAKNLIEPKDFLVEKFLS